MQNRHSKTSIFLMEFIVSILLFSIASAVCIQLFVQTHLKSKASVATTHAVVEAQNAAEILRSTAINGNDVLTEMCEIYPLATVSENNVLTIYFDNDFQSCTKDAAIYQEKLTYSYENNLCTLTIFTTKLTDGEEIFSMPVQVYRGDTK
ncbi:MAG: hypothetical protein Q4D54_04005 [Eubacteriales bacterium]|nr:hypothetical protein [Lachnospiraceae bacterium]MDO5126896.1 hypothetical protein [Eubacteriales bacterium]